MVGRKRKVYVCEWEGKGFLSVLDKLGLMSEDARRRSKYWARLKDLMIRLGTWKVTARASQPACPMNRPLIRPHRTRPVERHEGEKTNERGAAKLDEIP